MANANTAEALTAKQIAKQEAKQRAAAHKAAADEVTRNGVKIHVGRHKLNGGVVKTFDASKFGNGGKAKRTLKAMRVGRTYAQVLAALGHASVMRRLTAAGVITWSKAD